MGEPIRFELSNGDRFGYKVSIPHLLPNRGDRLAVREDRATEVDRDKVAVRLAIVLKAAGDHRADNDYRVEADRILSLVFGEEASRV